MEIKGSNRLEYLDSARGLAAISVVWGHFLFQYGIQDSIPVIAYSPLRIFYNAIPAVSFFFVLSGMVLSYKYFARPLQLNYKQYFITRIFRIYPAFLVVLLLSFIIQFFWYKQIITSPQIATGRDFWSETISSVKLLKEAALFSNISGSSALVSQRWSVIVEMQISLLIPFMILITQKSIYWLFSLVLLIMIFFYESPPAVYFLHFGLGIFIAYKNKEIITAWNSGNYLQKILFFIAGLLLYNYRYMVPFLQQVLLPEQS